MNTWRPNPLQWVVIWVTFLTASHISLNLDLSDLLPRPDRTWGVFPYLEAGARTTIGRNHLSLVVLTAGGLILWQFSTRRKTHPQQGLPLADFDRLKKRCELLVQANQALDALCESEDLQSDQQEVQRLQNILDSLTLQAMQETPQSEPAEQPKGRKVLAFVILAAVFIFLWMQQDRSGHEKSPGFGRPAFQKHSLGKPAFPRAPGF